MRRTPTPRSPSSPNCFPVYTLTRSYRAGGEDLADLVNRRFYGGKIDSLPWAGTYLGHGSLTLNYVSGGQGMPDSDTGAVESTDAEVSKVVELVLEHAVNRAPRIAHGHHRERNGTPCASTRPCSPRSPSAQSWPTSS